MGSLSPTPRKFRILMLHGYAQSSERFRVKARLLVDQITNNLLPHILNEYPDGFEFIFPDAPFRFGSDGDNSNNNNSGLDSRAWWLNLDDVSRYIGLENTLLRLSESLDGQPIHAAIGFSQGGGLAAMITGLCDAATNMKRRGMLAAQGLPVDTFLTNLPGQRPLKFVVCISGFRGTMKYYSSFYTPTLPTLTTPSLHIIAALDTMIAGEKSRDLLSVFETPEVVYHDGGHYIPRDLALLKRVGSFVTDTYNKNPRGRSSAPSVPVPARIESTRKPTSPSAKRPIMRKRTTHARSFPAYSVRLR